MPGQKIRESMTKNPRTVPPSCSIRDAAALMRELDVGALPVVEGDHFLGMVTDRDITLRVTASGRSPGESMVSDAMTKGVVCCDQDAEIAEAIRLMERHQIRRLPIIDATKRLVGIVSLGDLALERVPQTDEALREISKPN